MQDEKQYEQLIMMYTQLKNGAEDISRMIDNENYDDAITMIQSREQVFLSCKGMRRYLELTPVQQKEVDTIIDEIRTLEIQNIKKLERGMDELQIEIKRSQKSQKLNNAYDNDIDSKGSLLNIQE